jgi:glycosyltransferase involved in cell wall biosynthesis
MIEPPLNLLCIEPRFPGRLGAVADWLVLTRGYRVQFYCHKADPQPTWPSSTGRGIEVVAFNVGGVARESSVDWPRVLERSICYAYGCYEVLEARKPKPIDLILARSKGLGSSLYAPVVYPGVPIVQLFDTYFDPQTPHETIPKDEASAIYRQWRIAGNACELVELENGVHPWTPTHYQHSLFPQPYQDDFLVLHDGIDTRKSPSRSRDPLIIQGKTITPETKVLTFCARSLDLLRGFDRFAELASKLMKYDANLVTIAIGSTIVDQPFDYANYGSDFATSWIQQYPSSIRDRFIIPGVLNHADMIKVMTRSDLHVYTSRSHPVSRSLLEAMSLGCPVMAFDSLPVREVIKDKQTGWLSEPDIDSAVKMASRLLEDRDASVTLGNAAKQHVQTTYSQDVTLPKLASYFHELVNSRG